MLNLRNYNISDHLSLLHLKDHVTFLELIPVANFLSCFRDIPNCPICTLTIAARKLQSLSPLLIPASSIETLIHLVYDF